MRKFILFMCCLMMATLSVPIMGCSESPHYSGVDVLSKQKVQLTGNIEGLKVMTKASIENGFTKGDSIWVFANYPSGNVLSAKGYYDGYEFRLSRDLFYPVNGSLSITALYPASLYTIHNDSAWAQGTFTYSDNITDPLVAVTKNLYSRDTVINLDFKHSLSLLRLNITEGQEYFDGAWVISSENRFVYSCFGDYSCLSIGNDTIELNNSLIIPEQDWVRLVVRSGDNMYYYPGSIPNESGKITNIDISLSPSELRVIRADIKPWELGEDVDWDIKV